MNDSGDDYKQRLTRLRNLVVMAFADGSLGQREVNLVADRCVELELASSDLEHALAYGLSEGGSITVPDSPAEREETIRELIRMMAADGFLAEAEKRLLAFAAAKMDIDGDELNRIIDSFDEHR